MKFLFYSHNSFKFYMYIPKNYYNISFPNENTLIYFENYIYFQTLAFRHEIYLCILKASMRKPIVCILYCELAKKKSEKLHPINVLI